MLNIEKFEHDNVILLIFEQNCILFYNNGKDVAAVFSIYDYKFILVMFETVLRFKINNREDYMPDFKHLYLDVLSMNSNDFSLLKNNIEACFDKAKDYIEDILNIKDILE